MGSSSGLRRRYQVPERAPRRRYAPAGEHVASEPLQHWVDSEPAVTPIVADSLAPSSALMTESQRAFYRKETRTPSSKPGVESMRCYFMSGGHIFDVEMLGGLSDEEAVAKAMLLFSEHEGPIQGFEVWDRARVVFRHHPDIDRSEKAAE
jgi:hypothetical protein